MIQIDRRSRSLVLLLSASGLVAFPHLFHLPWPITGFFFLLLVWRLAAVRKPSMVPGKTTLALLMIAALALIVLENHGILGRDAGTGALLVAMGLKLMELKSSRDTYFVVFLAFFVAMTQFLFSQSLFMAGYVFAVCWLLVATLMSLNGESVKTQTLFKTGAGLIVQSVPIMIFLFVFFPRIPVPNLDLFQPESKAVTGLSDILEPGRISQLSFSYETAFRVTFNGPVPPPQQRYWRGPVFWHSDGKRWTLSKQKASVRGTVRFSGQPYHYTVILEPHQRKWLFALDRPISEPDGAFLTHERMVLSKTKVTERITYQLTSRPGLALQALSPADRVRGLQLPNKPSARVVSLLERWRRGGADPAGLVQKALDFFHNEPFVYTLTPPLLNEDPVEAFLFETQSGFCEHYSTAFVYLMRAAGIPARVVTGYQGGEFNGIGNFIEVRQADAHAWAEVWLNKKGWTRIDPTAAVAPERTRLGIDAGRQIATGRVAFAVSDTAGVVRWLQQARQLWASFDHAWNRWVLGYGVARQARLLDYLGMGSLLEKALTLVAVFAGLMLMLTYWVLRGGPVRTDPIVAQYRKFCTKLARRKLLKNPAEGPRDFALRAIRKFPERRSEIREITRLYVRLRYGRRWAPDDFISLKRRVRQFRA